MLRLTRIGISGTGRHVDRLEIGRTRITRIADVEGVSWPARALFRDLDRDLLEHAYDRMPPGSIDPVRETIALSFNSYLVETPEGVTLVDTGIGADKDRHDRPAWHQRRSDFLTMLAAIGVPPPRVDLVINTHLHADHVGFNTIRDGDAFRPAFPRARYVVPAADLVHWAARFANEASQEVLHGAFGDSVQPLIEAGLLESVDLPPGSPVEVAPGVRLASAPGHSPGMAVVHIVTGEEEIVILADAIHHPIQLIFSDLVSNFCANPALARESRHRILADCAHRGAILAPYHFPAPGFGRLNAAADGLVPIPYVDSFHSL
jgi:glyoxylase-like metal-dependent hydrolase (beta-lactamase superfamily II)